MNTNQRKQWPCVMIDIETLGTKDDAVILEIGCVCFSQDREMGPVWGMVVDHAQQPGRMIDADTLQWWLEPERISTFADLTRANETKPMLWHALNELDGFISRELAPAGEVWAKGDFDLRILGHAFEQDAFSQCPWKYFQARELRTLLKFAGVVVPKGETVHRAVMDAVAQVNLLWQAADLLRGIKWDEADWEGGWNEYRGELATTCAMVIPAWGDLHGEVREAWCAGVRAVLEAGIQWSPVAGKSS